jgi:hypothetical protein
MPLMVGAVPSLFLGAEFRQNEIKIFRFLTHPQRFLFSTWERKTGIFIQQR